MSIVLAVLGILATVVVDIWEWGAIFRIWTRKGTFLNVRAKQIMLWVRSLYLPAKLIWSMFGMYHVVHDDGHTPFYVGCMSALYILTGAWWAFLYFFAFKDDDDDDQLKKRGRRIRDKVRKLLTVKRAVPLPVSR